MKKLSKTAEVLNNFFSNIVTNLKIPEYENLNLNSENVKDPVFKAILKYKNHPSIIAIKEKSKNSKFTFHKVDNEKVIKEIKRLSKIKPLKSPIFLSQLFTKTLIFLQIF